MKRAGIYLAAALAFLNISFSSAEENEIPKEYLLCYSPSVELRCIGDLKGGIEDCLYTVNISVKCEEDDCGEGWRIANKYPVINSMDDAEKACKKDIEKLEEFIVSY